MTVTINGTTGVSGVAGSASTPALIGSDADSGYYINSANEPNASVNGTAVWNAASTFGYKNRIMNGDFRVSQYNAASSGTPSGTGQIYYIDRFYYYASQASKFTMGQNLNSVTPPAGFSNYYGLQVASAVSIGSGDRFLISQGIEAYNIADLNWGTANAATVTLSFWVRSSLTGTFGGVFGCGQATLSYPFTYTISSANTWEQKTITIAGPTSGGTWTANNQAGLYIQWGLGVGSTYSGAAGSWTANNYNSATGATSVVGTGSATWYITGVQLEKGSTATSFDYRPYGTELQLCQRYYEVVGIAAEGLLAYYTTGNGNAFKYQSLNFAVTKRTSPTMPNVTASNQWVVSGAYAVSANTSHTFQSQATTTGFSGLCIRQAGGTAPTAPYAYNWEGTVTFTASAEL